MGLKLDAVISAVNSKAKEDIITYGMSTFKYDRVPFTSPRMNYVTYGGLALGRIVEFWGEEGGGKTTSALDIVANYQNMFPDKDILYIDAENTLDVEWATKLNVDTSKLIVFQPKTQSAEDVFNVIYDAVCTGEVGLWVLDSVAALESQQAWDKDIGEKTYGGISQPLAQFAKKMIGVMMKYQCLGIAINQIRENLNSPYGGVKTPGGHAWLHFCSTRIQFSKGKYFDEKGADIARSSGEPAGNYVMANMNKTKTSKPTRHLGQYRIRYDIGIDYLADLIDVAILDNIIVQKGAWFTIVDTETGEVIKDKIQGQSNVRKVLDEEIDVLKRVEELVDKSAETD